MLELLQQSNYDRNEIKSRIDSLLNEIDFYTLLPKAGRILLKPNFVVPSPKEDPSCTHPDFYMAIATLLLGKGYQVGIGESPAFGSCRAALKAHGVLEEVESLGIEVVEFKTRHAYKGPKDEKAYQDLTIAAEIKQWDRLINLPKIKVHQQFMFTAACKNLYGCVVGKRKFFLHNKCKNDPTVFAKMILANVRQAQAILHIGDAITAMHVKGPRGGKPYALGEIIVSDNPLAHDWLVCKIIGLDPLKTPLFKVLSDEVIQDIEQKCESIISASDFEVAKGFEQSYSTDISFSPYHILRSFYRGVKFKLSSQS